MKNLEEQTKDAEREKCRQIYLTGHSVNELQHATQKEIKEYVKEFIRSLQGENQGTTPRE